MSSPPPTAAYTSTASLCPVCLARIPASYERQGDAIFLVKQCPEHGHFRSIIWKGPIEFSTWIRPKKPSLIKPSFTVVDQGCPFDCGLCPEHGQHTCTALIEITNRCNLHCPVCFADAGSDVDKREEPSLSRIGFFYDQIMAASGPCNIQISGGEPTMRADLPEIIALGRSKGFPFLQLNTNGLRLAEDLGYTTSLKKAGLSSIFLQFDGLVSSTHTTLRGCDLTAIKEQALLHCQAAGLAVVLVPTLVPGVNTHEVSTIINYAIRFAPTVRGVHFQPISYFGRLYKEPGDQDRLTLPELLLLLESQSAGAIAAKHFSPPACEHALCSLHGNFLINEDGTLLPLGQEQKNCCSTGGSLEPTPSAMEGREKSIAFTARQWSLSSIPNKTAYLGQKKEDDLDRFLARACTHTFSISAMAFQDVWNLDLERLRGCCIHVVSPEGHLIPFCAYNLSSKFGVPLYRRRRHP